MRVFVVYADYGSYEGCSKPEVAFLDKAQAALWLHETNPPWKNVAVIDEIAVLDAIPQEKDHD